jgi:hypothetical protein
MSRRDKKERVEMTTTKSDTERYDIIQYDQGMT